MGLDPDALAYITAITTAGATVTSVQQNAIDTFVKTGKSDGWYSSLKRLYLPIWANAAANAICLRSLTSGTFVGGVTHAAGYAEGNGTNGYFNFNASMPSLGISENNCMCGVLAYAAPTLGSYMMHAQAGTVPFGIRSTSTDLLASTYLNNAVGYNSAQSNHYGIIVASRTSASSSALYQRQASGFFTRSTSATAPTGSPGSESMFLFARNFQGAPNGYCAFKAGSAFVSLGMSSADVTAFSINLKTLWETLTGLTLP